MEPITTIAGAVSDLDRADVDTDQIIPKQFLKRIERTGFGEFLFFDWAKEPGWELPRNPILTRGATSAAAPRASTRPGRSRTTASGPSSRRASATSSTATAPRSACSPSSSTRPTCARSRAAGDGEIDLEAQEVRFDGRAVPFEIDAEIRRRLLGGLDDIALTLQESAAIDAYESAASARPSYDGTLDVPAGRMRPAGDRCMHRSRFARMRANPL